jgi:flagellar assembly protein FliH
VSGKIAQKVIAKEFKYDSGIEKILDQNLKKIIGANDIIIKLNPEDFELIRSKNREYLGSSGISKIKFEPNENVQVGGCLVESEIGNLDARVESRIAELIKALENHYLNIKSE